MEQFSKEQVKKIWERVQNSNGSTGSHPDLCGCAARELEVAAIYRYLARKLPGKTGQMLARFARQAQNHAASIKGICAVTYGKCPPIRGQQPGNTPVPVLLRRCYGLKLQAIAEYEKLADRESFGHIFRQLIREEQSQLQFLLHLMGNN